MHAHLAAGRAAAKRWRRPPSAAGANDDPDGGGQGDLGRDQAAVADPQARPDTDTQQQLRPPRDFAVVMHNDSYTTQQFVVMVLMAVFYHPAERATELMLQVDRSGAAVVGTYSFEIAESKIARVTSMARAREYPLRCTMEPQ